MKEISEEILDIILKDIHDDISDKETEILRCWREESKLNDEIYAEYLQINEKLDRVKPDFDLDVDNALHKVKRGKKIIVSKFMKYAAAIIIPFALGIVLFQFNSNSVKENIGHRNFAEVSHPGTAKAELVLASGKVINLAALPQERLKEKDGTEINLTKDNSVVYLSNISKSKVMTYNELRIPRGGEYQLVLSDGTKVWLNSESELRYPTNFTSKTREVYLVGEAFFDVSHDKNKPFIVHSGDMNVKVLGTRFNLRNYEEENAVTTLVQGKVLVENIKKQSCILIPGQQAMFKNEGIVKNDVDTDLYTSWIEGKFTFKNADMYSLSQQISRWYNVEIFFKNESAKNVRFTGTINKDKPLDYLIGLIESVSNVRFSVKGENIIIEKK